MQFGFPCVNAHPDADHKVSPGFALQNVLRPDGGFEGISRFMESGANSMDSTEGSFWKEAAMIDFYFVELAQVVVSLLVDAQIAAALRPW
jgi:hypothetical protein